MKDIAFGMLIVATEIMLALAGCSQLPTPPTRSFGAVDLLITDVSLFPAGWHVSTPAQVTRVFLWRNIGGATIEFGYPYAGHAWQQVSRFRNKQDAAAAYRDQDYYPGANNRWEPPEELSYRSPIADQFRLACLQETRSTHCVAKAQYEEFVSGFGVNADSYAISLGDLEPILRAIDERMASYLGKSMPPPTRSP